MNLNICFNVMFMRLKSQKRAPNVEISSQLTDGLNIDTPQKVNVGALKLKIKDKENKENLKNRALVFTIFITLGIVGYFITN